MATFSPVPAHWLNPLTRVPAPCEQVIRLPVKAALAAGTSHSTQNLRLKARNPHG